VLYKCLHDKPNTVYTDVEAFLKELGASTNRQIQVFLLDDEGAIVGRAEGGVFVGDS
jgi:hypothetical protein